MPLTIPNFVQFQAPLFPLRGLWNVAPAEGDRFVNAEVDWGTPGLTGSTCVQFQLSGNSPVAFSQIVAMSVDNSRCGGDVDFIFPDSGFILTVPGYNQGVYPVFTNALMFYASAPLAVLSDVTIIQVLNSMPPPVAIQPSSEQQQIAITGVSLTSNSVTPVVPAGVYGTLDAFSISIGNVVPATTGVSSIDLEDGTGKTLWSGEVSATETGPFSMSNLRLRFSNGINFRVFNATLSAGSAAINLYYSTP